jgi:hypothetical protein
VGITVATDALKMDGIAHTSRSALHDRVAGFFGAAVNAEAPAAELEHLRHEGQPIKPAVAVQSPEDFLAAPNLDDVACFDHREVCSQTLLPLP